MTTNYAPLLKAKALAELEWRKRAANKAPPALSLPTPYPLQAEIINHPAERKVVCAGRRVGKTIMAALMAVYALQQGKRILLSSTSQDQSDVFWEYIVNWLAPLYMSAGGYKNEVKRIIRHGGGEIRVKTGRNPDALRGGNVDLLVLDECAYLDPAAWRQVGAPMLADTEGSAVFISTPARRNWYFELYTQAVSDDSGLWAAWNFSTLENPHLSQEALNRLIADMTEDDYQQEILAQFLAGAGVVFRYIDERAILLPQTVRNPDHRYVFGVDWAQSKDFTVIVVMDMTTREMVFYDRFNGIDWSLQRGRLRTLYDHWQPQTIIAESNSVGSPNIEALQREGLPVKSFETTAVSKPPLIESLVLAFDRDEIKVLNDRVLKNELMAYERKVSPTTGRSQYSAPDGLHDDMVMALALAWHGITAPRPYVGLW